MFCFPGWLEAIDCNIRRELLFSQALAGAKSHIISLEPIRFGVKLLTAYRAFQIRTYTSATIKGDNGFSQALSTAIFRGGTSFSKLLLAVCALTNHRHMLYFTSVSC